MLTASGQRRPAFGWARLSDVAAWVETWAAPSGLEHVSLADAAGRVLAGDVTAAMDLPPFDRATADGFALRADETVGAGAYNPLPFRLAPASAGVLPGHAVAVESGDPLPAGADAVARPEQAMPVAPGTIAIIAPVAAGAEVERVASQGARGGALFAAGQQLGPGEVGLLASAGVMRVPVVVRPRVRCLLAAGGLSEAGQALAPGAVYDANGPMLAALIERDGGTVVDRRRIERDRSLLRDALGASLGAPLGAPGADVILVAGGTGPGAGDEAAAALVEAGELVIHGVAIRPGETAGAGRAFGVPVLLLPGTPAACLWAYELLAGPAIRRLAGRSVELPFATRQVRLSRKVVSEIGMTDVCPVRCTIDGEVEPLAPFAEAGLVVAAQGDGFVVVPESSEGYPQGAPVTVHLYPGRGRTPRVTAAVQHQSGKRGV
jgi:molybdopterin molybdotransferase